MIRTATAHWEGNLKDGKGSFILASNILKRANYSYKTRFEDGATGTNPEYLLAATHAGCFTMAFKIWYSVNPDFFIFPI